MCKLELDFAIVAVLHSHYTLLVVSNGMAPWVQNMTPWLWESPIYINIFMNSAILSELLGQFGLKMAWLSQKQTKQA